MSEEVTSSLPPAVLEVVDLRKPTGAVERLADIKAARWKLVTVGKIETGGLYPPPTEEELAARRAVEERRETVATGVHDWLQEHQANLSPAIYPSPGMDGWNERIGVFDGKDVNGMPIEIVVYAYEGTKTILGYPQPVDHTPGETTIEITERNKFGTVAEQIRKNDWGSMIVSPSGNIQVEHTHIDESAYSREHDLVIVGGDVQRFAGGQFFQKHLPDSLDRATALLGRLQDATPRTTPEPVATPVTTTVGAAA